MEVGENLIEGLIREIKEESGNDSSVSYLIGVYSNLSTSRFVIYVIKFLSSDNLDVQ
ncbi:hypothetical protein D3C76_1803940 [compost metagenome]